MWARTKDHSRGEIGVDGLEMLDILGDNEEEHGGRGRGKRVKEKRMRKEDREENNKEREERKENGERRKEKGETITLTTNAATGAKEWSKSYEYGSGSNLLADGTYTFAE